MGEVKECLTLFLTQIYEKGRIGNNDTTCQEINLNTPMHTLFLFNI